MTLFRWKNCFADVLTSKHDLTIRSYFDDVIIPALTTLETKIAELENSDRPEHVFVQTDMKQTLRETKLAFGLSIQSIWERQLRTYLNKCAKELNPNESITDQINQANWQSLCVWFCKLRGIKLERFPSFLMLDTLHHLGNACRHGDGKSASKLSILCPDLWPVIPRIPPIPPSVSTPFPSTTPSVSTLDIPVERLGEFVAAIAEFWQDTKHIYNESIEPKDSYLEARLVLERTEHNWLSQIPAVDDQCQQTPP